MMSGGPPFVIENFIKVLGKYTDSTEKITWPIERTGPFDVLYIYEEDFIQTLGSNCLRNTSEMLLNEEQESINKSVFLILLTVPRILAVEGGNFRVVEVAVDEN